MVAGLTATGRMVAVVVVVIVLIIPRVLGVLVPGLGFPVTRIALGHGLVVALGCIMEIRSHIGGLMQRIQAEAAGTRMRVPRTVLLVNIMPAAPVVVNVMGRVVIVFVLRDDERPAGDGGTVAWAACVIDAACEDG